MLRRGILPLPMVGKWSRPNDSKAGPRFRENLLGELALLGQHKSRELAHRVTVLALMYFQHVPYDSRLLAADHLWFATSIPKLVIPLAICGVLRGRDNLEIPSPPCECGK